MNAGEWIALGVAVFTIGGGSIGALIKFTRVFTRMADALERLTGSMETVVTKVDGHEARISALEARSPGRHARVI